MKTIRFKSNQDNWKKEYLGLKRNTVRRFTINKDDIRQEVLDNFIDALWTSINIEIENTLTKETFIRQVTDVTKWHDFYIISW